MVEIATHDQANEFIALLIRKLNSKEVLNRIEGSELQPLMKKPAGNLELAIQVVKFINNPSIWKVGGFTTSKYGCSEELRNEFIVNLLTKGLHETPVLRNISHKKIQEIIDGKDKNFINELIEFLGSGCKKKFSSTKLVTDLDAPPFDPTMRYTSRRVYGSELERVGPTGQIALEDIELIDINKEFGGTDSIYKILREKKGLDKNICYNSNPLTFLFMNQYDQKVADYLRKIVTRWEGNTGNASDCELHTFGDIYSLTYTASLVYKKSQDVWHFTTNQRIDSPAMGYVLTQKV